MAHQGNLIGKYCAGLTLIVLFVLGFLSSAHAFDSIDKSAWSVHYVDSEELSSSYYAPATAAIDSNPNTYWHSEWHTVDPDPAHPHEIQIDLGASYLVDGFRYYPRLGSSPHGRVLDYEFYLSADGTQWGAYVAAGTWPDSDQTQEVTFTAVQARYIRLVALSARQGKPWTSVAELEVSAQTTANAPPNGTIVSPTAAVTISPGDTVDFTGNGTDPDNNTPLTYLWTFGDPAVADAAVQNPGAVQFDTAGAYTVTFTVTDALGAVDPTPATVAVNVVQDPPPPTEDSLVVTENGDVGIGTNTPTANLHVKGALKVEQGTIQQGEGSRFHTYAISGQAMLNTAFSHDLYTCGGGHAVHVEAVLIHPSAGDRTAADKIFYMDAYTGLNTDILLDEATAAAGSWTFERIVTGNDGANDTSDRLRVTHIAGTDAASGNYYIHIKSTCPVYEIK